MNRRRISTALLAAVCLAVPGCGVSEYEQRMGDEQTRLDYFDRENQMLEGPLKLPEKKEEKKDDKAQDSFQPNEIFLRPPRGIATTPQPSPGAGSRFPVAQQNAPGPFQDLRLFVAKSGAWEAFQDAVLKNLGVVGTKAEKVLTPPGRPPMKFDHFRADAAGLQVFFYREGNFQAAVVFTAAKPDATGAVKSDPAAIDLSLGTLLLGLAAYEQHRQYQARRPTAPGK